MIKKIMYGALMAFTMFSAIPLPFHGWDEDARPFMILFLPLVGVLHGFLWMSAAMLLTYFNVNALLASVLLSTFPFLLSGFIHIDGFMDVTDAIKSCRSKEERIRILKDPNCGSFAVISAIILFAVQFASLFVIFQNKNFLPLIFIPTISRTLSSLCVSILPTLAESQYNTEYQNKFNKLHISILFILFFATILCAVFYLDKYSFTLSGVILGYMFALQRAYSSLGGISGDVSGFCITISEMVGLLVLALAV
ncbi:MAG: adenosylcobinamide-GDP ribazoletransferase [Synergistaceae bacterium]|nr:adenosylcobinamide-GDP ribazoletransferase [Synergistaceae bacterium]